MASSPLTLAALATSAVPGLVVHGTREHVGEGGGEFSSAVLVCDDEDLIVRVPQTQAAEVAQSAELLSLTALTAGARARLPFSISEPRGMTRAGDTRAVVSTFLAGNRIAAASLDPEALILESLANALAAIHELPHSLAHQHGLTVRTAEDVRITLARLVERAEMTRLLPDLLQTRWRETLRTAELWDFAPAMIHGSLSIDQFLVEDDVIVGVLGWSELSVGDPAADLAWLATSGEKVLDQVLRRYANGRGIGQVEQLRARTLFHHELEVARWLLHGVDQHDSGIVDDAVAMLDQLVDRVSRRPASDAGRVPLSGEELSQLLDDMPEAPAGLSDTAAYEALDEDRMFHVDTDFVDPVEEPHASGTSAEPGETPPSGEASGEALTEPVEPLEQETQPVDPDALPER